MSVVIIKWKLIQKNVCKRVTFEAKQLDPPIYNVKSFIFLKTDF